MKENPPCSARTSQDANSETHLSDSRVAGRSPATNMFRAVWAKERICFDDVDAQH